MLTHLLKFIHVLIAIGILGCAISCFLIVSSKKINASGYAHCYKLNKLMLNLIVMAMILGTLLVHPKHYTFHTHWIQAAYFLVATIIVSIFLLQRFLKKIRERKKYFWQLAYLILIVIIGCIIRDAVMKNNFFF